MRPNPLPLVFAILICGVFFFLLGLSVLWGMFWGAVAIFFSNRFTYGSWKTHPWGDLW